MSLLRFNEEVSTSDLWRCYDADSRVFLLFRARQVFALNPDK